MTRPTLKQALALRQQVDRLAARASAIIGITHLAYVQSKLYEFDEHLDAMARCLTENIRLEQNILNDVRRILLLRKEARHDRVR